MLLSSLRKSCSPGWALLRSQWRRIRFRVLATLFARGLHVAELSSGAHFAQPVGSPGLRSCGHQNSHRHCAPTRRANWTWFHDLRVCSR